MVKDRVKEARYPGRGRTMSPVWNTDSKASLGLEAKLSFGQDECEVPGMVAVSRVRRGRTGVSDPSLQSRGHGNSQDEKAQRALHFL